MNTTKDEQQNNETNQIERAVVPLFSMPFYRSELGEPTKQALDFCHNTEYVRYKADNGWVSKNKYVLESKELVETKAMIMREFNIFMHNILSFDDKYQFYITNSWIQKISTGDYTHQHAHENSLVSGVYYLEVFEDSGDFTVEKSFDTMNILPTFVTFLFKESNPLNSLSWTIRPQNGTFVLFPSHMAHNAGVNRNAKERYCIAFNSYVRGVFGETDGVSDLVLR